MMNKRRLTGTILALAALFLLTASPAEAKGKPGRKSKKTEAAAEKADTTKRVTKHC